jgi:hypothetical protein
MLQPYVINIDGAFVGAAACLNIGYRFIPSDVSIRQWLTPRARLINRNKQEDQHECAGINTTDSPG